mgnify:CR=1 FL=1
MLGQANLVSSQSGRLLRRSALHLKRSLMLYTNAGRKQAVLLRLPYSSFSNPTTSSVFCMQRYVQLTCCTFYKLLYHLILFC